MKKISITKDDKILIIAPHPDDESIGVGGLLCMFSGQCSVWLLTDGCKGGQAGTNHNAMASIRKTEFKKVMSFLGIDDYRCFDIEDRTLASNLDLFQNEEVSQYSKIFIPNEHDIHPDHRASFKALVRRLRVGNYEKAEVFQYEITAPFTAPSHYLDITGYERKKKKLIAFYESQLEQADYYDIALSLNRFRAAVLEMKEGYVETFLFTDYKVEENRFELEKFELEQRCEKIDQLLHLYDEWIGSETSGKSIAKLLDDKDAAGILVYGCGLLGKRLVNVLRAQGVKVTGFIDKYIDSVNLDIPVYKPIFAAKTMVEKTVIVTALYDLKKIRDELLNLGFEKIVSFDELLSGKVDL